MPIGGGEAKAMVPRDLKQTRRQQIGLMQYLMGFGSDPRVSGWQSPQQQKVFDGMRRMGFNVPQTQQNAPMSTGPGTSGNDVASRMESFFGPLGVPTSPLQQQSVGGMQQFLASNPYEQAQTAMNQILGNPGEAFRPDFERALAAANQTGGRFGSANALMRANALNDYNSQVLKHQLSAADMIRMLGGQQVNDMTAGFNMGNAQANQEASRQQQALQLLLQQLGVAQSASFNVPITQSQGLLGGIAQVAGAAGGLLPFLNLGGGSGGRNPSVVGAPAYGSPNQYG